MKSNHYTSAKNQISTLKKLSLFLSLILISTNIIGQSGEVINLGLYGGTTQDYSWAYSTNRLFSVVETPATLFYTDDTCNSWIQAFPVDSLEYTTGSTRRGWGGGGRRVVSNWTGWVGVYTSEQGGTLSSTVISFNDGDSGTFRTAIDGYLLNQIDPSFNANTTPSAITISDHWFYVGLSNALTRINDTSTYGPHNILLKLDTVTAVGTNTSINWLAVSSSSNGYPVLFVSNTPGNQYGKLFTYDGTSVSEITGLPSTYGFEKVFTHPAYNNTDTLIVSAREKAGNGIRVYRTFDGGSTWSNVSPAVTNWPLQNADYNPDWVSLMPLSNGLRLSFPGVDKSDNLGDTWSNHMLEDNASTTHPVDTSYVVGSKNKGTQLSTTGAQGTFINANNEGHSAIRITKIAQKDTNIYYVATKAGLGYTTAYRDPTVQGVDQWRPPYGDFPITGVGTDGGVTSVAVDPTDSLHVVAGSTNGFYITTTGPSGFTYINPTGWDTGTRWDTRVTDIKFVSPDTIVAVSGTGSNTLPNSGLDYGHIWISYDGGNNWSKSAPTDIDGSGTSVTFEQGNTIVVGFGSTDTIIYVGCGYYDMNNPKEDGQIWKSDDFGTTWSFVNYGPTGLNGGTTRMPIYDMDIHPEPDSNEVLYIASGENLDYAFCKSIDGGATYNYLGVSGHGAFSSVLVKKNNPVIVSVAARRNLFRYNSVLASTTTVFEGLPGEFVPDLETGSTLLGTTTGLYKLVEDPGSVTTIWNGTGDWSDDNFWSNGIPYEISNAVIETGTVNIDMSGKAYEVTIIPSAAVTVSSGNSLTIGGDFILESDETGYASFIDNGTIIVDGDITIQRYITDDQWHYITPPISDAKSGVFAGLWLDYWDEPSDDWVSITSTTEDLLAGKGYKTWASSGATGDVTLEFMGTINTGGYSPTLSLSGDPNEYGWNLIGNNFPSAIDWGTDNNPIPGLVKNDIDNTIYFWNGVQYATYNPSGNGGDGEGTNGGTQYIPSMQGFFIHANDVSPVITIPQSARLHNSQPFRMVNNTSQSLSFKVYSTNYSDEAIISVNPLATDGFDYQWDAYKLFGINQAPQLYSVVENQFLAVNHQPMLNHNLDIPIGFEAGSPQLHTIVVNNTDSFYSGTSLLLEDTQEDMIINIKSDTSYTFFGSPGDNPNRFVLHIDNSTVGYQVYDTQKDNIIYAYDDDIIVENISGNTLTGQFKVYDIMGRLILEEKLQQNSKQVFSINFPKGTYIAMICNRLEIQTKKITIK